MKDLKLSLEKFCKTFGRNGQDGFANKRIIFGPEKDILYPNSLPSSEELLYFYKNLYFEDIPTIGGSFFLEIKMIEKLEAIQHGWRWVSEKNGPMHDNPKWNKDWVVFALRHGDALAVDTSGEKSPIYGCVQSTYFLIANSMAAFFDVISDCMICENIEFHMNTQDDTCAPLQIFLDKIEVKLKEKLTTEEVSGIMRFFFD